MPNSATQLDAPGQDQQQEEYPEYINPRDEALKLLEQNRDKVLEEEIGQPLAQDEDDLQTADDVPSTEGATQSNPAVTPAGDDVFELKVDGEVRQVSRAEVIELAQKNAAADRRLELATNKLREAERLREEAAITPQADPTHRVAVVPQELLAMRKQAFTALVDGDEDTYVDLTAKADALLLQQAQEQALSVPTVKQVVNETLTEQKQKSDQEDAWDTFCTTYPEFRDEQSETRRYGDFLFDTEYSGRVAAGEISYQQALIDAAERVRKVFNPPPVADVPSTIDRQKNLQQAEQIPTATTRASGEQDDDDQDGASVIRELARMRPGSGG